MQANDIQDILKSTGLPVTYYAWPVGEVPNLPYICWLLPSDDDVYADDGNYVHVQNVDIELYTETKDWDAEALVETALKTAGIPYDRTEQYITQERMFQVVYSISLVIND